MAKESWWKKATQFGLLGMLGGGDDWGAKDPSIMTKTIEDPYKRAVTSPLSQYLAGEMGKGVGAGPAAGFLEMEPEKFFEEKVAAPTMRRWREDVAPEISEGWAGSLRGSGRYRSLEESAGAVSEKLATIGGQMVPQLYQQQFQTWLQTLPQYNPALGQAMAFLQRSTSTGTTTLAALDPGKEGWFKDLLGMGAQIASAAITACWVAAEIFGGWSKLKTILARQYIIHGAPTWFRDLYIIYGERVAKFIHNKPVFKLFLRPLFEYFVWKGGKLLCQAQSLI